MLKVATASTSLLALLIVHSSVQAAENTATEDAIRQTAEAFTDAYDRGNAEAIAALWAPDAEYIVGNNRVKGCEAIGRLYAEFFKAHPGSKMKVTIDSIRVLAPTVAIEQGTASVSGSANGGPSTSAYTAVHVKQGDKWLMANVRESEMPSSGDEDLADLGWLVGEWAAQGDVSKIAMTYRWMSDKHFLRGETTITSKDGSKSGGMQIIGKDPQSGRITSWFFNADGGHGMGQWSKVGSRYVIDTLGMSADGAPTSATNVLYQADDRVASWKSVNRTIGDVRLPDTKEVVMERVGSNN
jgi:uncharacterized protein (TIGR02246 family)